jgi:predicted transcriptional regulator
MSESIFILKFAEAKQPAYKEKKAEGYIEFGEKNDYPNYLLDLFNKSAKHGAIIRNKAKYVAGNGWVTESGVDSAFVAKVMLDVLARKVALDAETFGGSYIEVIWGTLGRQIAAVNHIEYSRIRTNKDNTQFWYKEDWMAVGRDKQQAKVIPAFNPTTNEKVQILFVKEYRPGGMAYPLPGYISALNFIESDIEVSKHVLGNASTGFTPSKLITLPNGEPSEEEKAAITKKFEQRFTGSDGKKFILSFVTDVARKPIIDDLGSSDMTKEDFTAVDTLIQNNIFAGHEITSPSLFGIAQPGKLGTSTELKDAYEIFKNTYANDKQMLLEGVFNMLARYAGYNEVLKIMPVNPIGLQVTFTDLISMGAPKEYLYELAGIDASKYQPTQEAGAVPLGATNEALRSMTGKQHQQLLRIIRQVGQGKLTREAATVMLKSALGLSDEDISTMLGVDELPQQMSSQDAISVFAAFGESKANYNILASRMRFDDQTEYEAFADVSQMESNVLDLIAKDKRITPEVIADTLKVTVKRVTDIINVAVEKGLIKTEQTTIGKGDQKNVVIERKLTQPLAKIVEEIKPKTTQFLVRYSYEWLPKIPANERNTEAHPSRDFCKQLMSLDRLYSRADIETISAQVGYSVFDRRGGWWNDNGDTKPHCRHRWFSQIVTRK